MRSTAVRGLGVHLVLQLGERRDVRGRHQITPDRQRLPHLEEKEMPFSEGVHLTSVRSCDLPVTSLTPLCIEKVAADSCLPC